MMRLRRASVIAALSLLAWAATASAECAWVMWTRVFGPSDSELVRIDPWSPIRTIGSRQECEDLLRQMNYHFDTGGGYIYAQGKRTWQATCLPDTVDPRGPKEGTR